MYQYIDTEESIKKFISSDEETVLYNCGQFNSDSYKYEDKIYLVMSLNELFSGPMNDIVIENVRMTGTKSRSTGWEDDEIGYLELKIPYILSTPEFYEFDLLEQC